MTEGGARRRGFVHAAGQLLARAEGGAIFWEHRQPATGGRWESAATGAAWTLTELDPLGAGVGAESPYEPGVTPAEPVVFDAGSHWGSRAGSPSDPRGECPVNGITLPCDVVRRMGDNGALSVLVDDPRGGAGQIERPVPGGSGGGARWVDTSQDVPTYDPETMTYGVASIRSGFFLNFSAGMAAAAVPQATLPQVRNYLPPVDVVAIRAEIERVLQDPVCATFIQHLLAEVSSYDPESLMEGGDILRIFDRIQDPSRGGGGTVRAGLPGSKPGGSQANGSFRSTRYPAQIQLGTYPGTAPPTAEQVRLIDGRTALAETLHLAGRDVYYDFEYALVINNLPRVGVLENKEPFPMGTGDPKGRDRYAYSGWWHAVVYDICK